MVLAVTGLVVIGNVVPLTPAGIVTDAGTTAAGELVERLTTAPLGPAKPPPARSTQPVIAAPPVASVGFAWNGWASSVGGSTLNWFEALTPLRLAVSVTSVGTLTCPTVIGNWPHA